MVNLFSHLQSAQFSPPALSNALLPSGALAVVKEVSLETQAKDGSLPGLIKASGAHTEVLGKTVQEFLQ